MSKWQKVKNAASKTGRWFNENWEIEANVNVGETGRVHYKNEPTKAVSQRKPVKAVSAPNTKKLTRAERSAINKAEWAKRNTEGITA
jgi:hypothetical protein